MNEPAWRMLADGVLVLHFAIVLFVVLGLVFILLGNRLGWRSANALWFRTLHLAAIGVVVAQAWIGAACPLTTLELWLRHQAGQSVYAQGFIEHWVGRVLFFTAPTWVFTLAYSMFGLAVAVAWWRFPPRRAGRRGSSG